MVISVINVSDGALSDAAVQKAIRAVNRQIEEDFAPYWGFGARLRLEGKSGTKRRGLDQADMRGDAVLYIHDVARIRSADGYHNANFRGIPYGFVFLEISRQLKEDWTMTLSHEALELLADPENNMYVHGPHPTQPKRQVFHWFEVCDAVQDESYRIDGVQVSNFVLPLYFTGNEERGGRNDFLGTKTSGKTLQSFSFNPGGYLGFFDPRRGTDVTLPKDKRGAERLRVKAKLKIGRGQLRQQRRVLE